MTTEPPGVDDPAAMCSESANEAASCYLVDAIDSLGWLQGMDREKAVLVAAYVQGAAAIHAAELNAKALDRLAAAIALTAAGPVRGTA